jgi:hypothetical protein
MINQDDKSEFRDNTLRNVSPVPMIDELLQIRDEQIEQEYLRKKRAVAYSPDIKFVNMREYIPLYKIRKASPPKNEVKQLESSGTISSCRNPMFIFEKSFISHTRSPEKSWSKDFPIEMKQEV